MKRLCCNYCGEDDTQTVTHGPDLLLNRPGDFTLVRCRNCGLIYQNPQLTPEELAPHYPQEYDPYARDISEEPSPFRRLDRRHNQARKAGRIIKYHSNPGEILDVGCATGLFLQTMKERGWKTTGVEPNTFASEYARRTFDLDVVTGTLQEAGLPDRRFDVVTMWDVLEHVPDPRATLAEVARIIKPGGLFVASVPNPTCIEARLFGDAWVGWDRPRHLYLFTPSVLRRYYEDAGLRLFTIESFSGRLGLTLLSVGFWCNARGIPEQKWRPWTDAIYNWPVRVLSWPFYWIAEAFNKTTVMTAFARLTGNSAGGAQK